MEKNFFDQLIKNNKITYKNIRKITTGQGDDYAMGCLLDYAYCRDDYKMIAIDLIKQQALDDDFRPIQQINFTKDLDHANNTAIFLVLDKAEEIIFDFSQGTVKVL